MWVQSDLMDATRYLEMEVLNIGRTEPKSKRVELFGDHYGYGGGGGSWMSS